MLEGADGMMCSVEIGLSRGAAQTAAAAASGASESAGVVGVAAGEGVETVAVSGDASVVATAAAIVAGCASDAISTSADKIPMLLLDAAGTAGLGDGLAATGADGMDGEDRPGSITGTERWFADGRGVSEPVHTSIISFRCRSSGVYSLRSENAQM